MNKPAYIGLKKILSERYPKKAGPYVISQSLLDNKLIGSKFGQIMKDYIGNIPEPSSINNYKLGNGSLSIQTAMNFLSSVIKNERNKEIQFINFLAKKSGTTPPATSDNWANFVKYFQQQLSFGQLGIIRLENELKRLKYNEAIEGKDIITKAGKEVTIYIRERLDVLEYTKIALNGVINYLSGKRSDMGKTIVNFICQQYGGSLINIITTSKNLDIELNSSNITGLILSISQLLIDSFYTKQLKEIDDKKELRKKTFLVNNFNLTMEKFLKEDKKANQQINNLIERTLTLPFYTEELIKTYKLTEIPESKSLNINDFILPTNQLSNEALSKILQKTTSTADYTPTIKLVKNTAGLAEVNSLLQNLAAGAFGENTGRVNAKPDNIIGYLMIDTSVMQNEEMKKDIIAAETAINDEINLLTEGLKNTNTTEYYTKRKKEWDEHIKKIDNSLAKLKETYNILANCFIIEDSTKHYVNMGIGNEKDFQGGSLGANIRDQINKIQALQDGNLINRQDADWLITAAINCGPNLIAQNLKNSLERYLAAFAVILLFDDQQNIANEVSQQMIKNIDASQTSVQKIHLFSLDGGYYPLSIVLQLTYDKLEQIYGLLESEQNNSQKETYGAQVEINGFINPDDFYPPHKYNNLRRSSWDELSAKAQASVKMQVKFITNFMGLLNTILNS